MTTTRPKRGTIDPAEKRSELEAQGEFVDPIRETYEGPVEEPPVAIDDTAYLAMLEAAAEIFSDDMSPAERAKLEVELESVKAKLQSGSLHEKLVEIMAAVDSVGKRGENTAQNYRYQKAVDVFNAVRPEFIKRGLLFITEVTQTKTTLIERQGRTPNVLVEIDARFIVSDGKDTFVFDGAGAGIDASGDKSVYKAITGAMKYGLRSLLMLPDENDPEVTRASEKEDVEGPAQINITSATVPGVRQGGRQSKATSAQLDAIKKAARDLMLTPETMAAHIVSTLGEGPTLTGDANADAEEILRFLAALSFEDCGKVVKDLVHAAEAAAGNGAA